MLKRWDHYLPSEKLRCRVYKGVLPQVRGQVWLRLLNVDQEMKEAALASSRDIMQIDLDVNRTFRSHTMFWDRYGVGQRALFHVLAAYSVYDTEVGYCQGMSEIAAIVLMFLPENAFWALAQLMTDDRHAMHGRGPPGRRAGEELRRASLQAAAPGGRRGPPSPPPPRARAPPPRWPPGPGATATHPTVCRPGSQSRCSPSLPPGCLPPRPPCQPTATRGPGGSISPSRGPPASLPSPTEGHARPSPSPWPTPAAPRGWGPACPRGGPCRREGAGSAGPGPQPPAHAPRGLCEDEGPRPHTPGLRGSPALWEEPVQSGLRGRWAHGGQGVGVGPCPDTPHPTWCRRRP
uniref:Rab-GAP TBC domain-containing protein n=1 Tax=Canis lupus familiaris TaxID=9615 RepID=A0A8C0TMF1_CANLF